MNEFINSKDSLNQKVFQNSIDITNFKNILDTLDGIQAVFISRKEFNEKKGDFLEETKSNDNGIEYNLYLPKDLQINELPSIIYRVNKLTFGDKLPEYASSNELKIKIVLAIDILLKELKEEKSGNKKVKKAIKNYVRLYSQMFGEEEAHKLNKTEYRQGIMDTRNIDKYKLYEKKLVEIQTLEDLGELESEIKKLVSQEIKDHFFESFLERGVNKIRLGMMTITQAEQDSLDISKEGTSIHYDSDKLDKQERLLREKMEINRLKQELQEVRKEGNIEKINEKEIEAANQILKVLYEYPYQMTDENYGYQPRKILENKEIYCVGFSIIGHAFLSELGIQHKGLMIPKHSALEVSIGSVKYNFDATSTNILVEVTYDEKVGNYHNIHPVKGKFTEDVLVISGDVEKVLMSHICNNKGNALSREGKSEEAIAMFDKAINIFPHDYAAYYNKGKELNDQEKFDEAIILFDKALERLPIDVGSYNNKGISFSSLGKYEEALDIYNKGLKLDPDNFNLNFNKGNALLNTNKPEEAIILYDKVLGIDPTYRQALNNKGNALYNQKKYQEALDIYKQTMKLHSEFSSTFSNAGMCLIKLKQTDKALDMFYKALEIDSNNLKAYKKIAEILSSSEKYQEALDIYNTAIKANPNDVELYYEKGAVLDTLERYEEAELVYKQAIELDPSNPNYYLDRGVALFNLGKYEDTIEMFDKTIELASSKSLGYTNKGMSLIKLGKLDLAEFYLYIGTTLEGGEISFEMNYQKEAKIIDKLLENKDFEGVREFLNKIEKEMGID